MSSLLLKPHQIWDWAMVWSPVVEYLELGTPWDIQEGCLYGEDTFIQKIHSLSLSHSTKCLEDREICCLTMQTSDSGIRQDYFLPHQNTYDGM
jgi:hypothetical protein